ncbi:MAG TPA: dihydrofolate reductase family protein [Gemmatimonadales bacterium]
MGKLVVITNLTLDGVMQSPGRPDEDRRGGFGHGGWAAPFGAMEEAGGALANIGALLLGRWTYESFRGFFPNQSDNPYTAFLTDIPKYVASLTMTEAPAWANTILLHGDATAAVARLKAELERDLVVFGSGTLVRSLMGKALVDDLVLLIHPLVLGTGRRLFLDNGWSAGFALRDVTTTSRGVVVATYGPAGEQGPIS